MSPASIGPLNRLLLALPPGDLSRLMPQLEQAPCRVRDVLLDADNPIDHVFFPDDCIVSVVAVYANGDIIEMATIGREGFTGFQAIFGVKMSAVRFLVQVPGSATRLSHAAFTRAMDSMPSFSKLMFAIRSGPSSAGPGFRRMQWQTQPQAATGALVACDA